MAETEKSVSRDRDETLTIFLETRRWYISRPSRDQDVETETVRQLFTLAMTETKVSKQVSLKATPSLQVNSCELKWLMSC